MQFIRAPAGASSTPSLPQIHPQDLGHGFPVGHIQREGLCLARVDIGTDRKRARFGQPFRRDHPMPRAAPATEATRPSMLTTRGTSGKRFWWEVAATAGGFSEKGERIVALPWFSSSPRVTAALHFGLPQGDGRPGRIDQHAHRTVTHHFYDILNHRRA